MKSNKLKLFVCTLLLVCSILFIPSRLEVFADDVEDVGKPIISGIDEQIDGDYQVGSSISIDVNNLVLTDDVDSRETLLLTLQVKMLTSVGSEIPSEYDDDEVYVFEFATSGTYTLVISVTDSNYNTTEERRNIVVKSNAEINKNYQKGRALSSSDFGDVNLYNALLEEVERLAETRGERFTGDTLYSEVFYYYPTFDEIKITDKNITSLEGLQNLRLEYIEKISITRCKITSIASDYFSECENLKEINFASNQITKVELSDFRNLQSVNLSSNKLTAIDLSDCWGNNIDINLAGNDIVSMGDIKLPRADGSIKLNLIGNNLSDVEDKYFTEEKLSINVGVQGIKNLETSATSDTNKGFRYYRSNVAGLELRVYDYSVQVPVVVKTVSDSDITTGTNYIDIKLPIGSYLYEYVLDGERVYNKYDENTNYYLSQKFVINPSIAICKFEHKGEMYDTIGKVTGAVIVHLSSEDLQNGANGKIMYRINMGDWIEGDKIDCSSGGSFSIKVKVVCGEYESEETTIFLQTSLNSVIPDVVMFFMILFVSIIFFVVVIPIISKKFFRK